MTQPAGENGWSRAEEMVMARLRGIEATQRETNAAIGQLAVAIGRVEERIDSHRHLDLEDADEKVNSAITAEFKEAKTELDKRLKMVEAAVDAGEPIRRFWTKVGDAAIGVIVPLLIGAVLIVLVTNYIASGRVTP